MASGSSLIIREAILTCDERLERWDSIPRYRSSTRDLRSVLCLRPEILAVYIIASASSREALAFVPQVAISRRKM